MGGTDGENRRQSPVDEQCAAGNGPLYRDKTLAGLKEQPLECRGGPFLPPNELFGGRCFRQAGEKEAE